MDGSILEPVHFTIIMILIKFIVVPIKMARSMEREIYIRRIEYLNVSMTMVKEYHAVI
jgi:hypothetical protein